MANDEKAPIIIKKVIKKGDGAHGGAWKVAYADFVTAMMAFFLLLWLLNVTTDEQKELISSYFSPSDPRVSNTQSGSGGVMGGLTMSDEGALAQDRVPVSQHPPIPQKDETGEGEGVGEGEAALEDVDGEALKAELDRRDAAEFDKAAEALKQALETSPELKALAENLMVDQTPEGLRIQMVDQKGRPMFPSGSYEPLPEAVQLLEVVKQVIEKMENKISIRGHTDSVPYGKGATYTNWELSSDRANASRRVLLEKDLDIKRIENVMGKADREHLLPKEPNSPRNRRISIILLKQSLVPGVKKEKPKDTEKDETGKPNKTGKTGKTLKREEPRIKKREEGIIYFP